MGIWSFFFVPETRGESHSSSFDHILTMLGVTLEEMDALFMKRAHKAVWAQLRGRPVIEDRPTSPDLVDEKLQSQFEQVEKKPSV